MPFHVIHLSCGSSMGWVKGDLSCGVALDGKKKKIRKGTKKIGSERKLKNKQEKAKYAELSPCDIENQKQNDNDIAKSSVSALFCII